MAKLLRVVLIDSLCPGDLVEVKVDENTCLTGTNGIGKSTFLKLIPLFFGASAGRMVKGGVNTLRFADHYLPNASSYIVYEYLNHEDELRTAILHRSSSGYAYQLLSSGWKPELLYKDLESGELVLPKDIQRHTAAMSIDCTPELLTMHYRKIIQYNTGSNDLDGVEDVSRKKMITLYRRSYSLAPPRHHFAGIDNLMFSLLESKGTFDSMESAVGEILQQEVMRSDINLSGIDAHAFASAINSRASFLVMEREIKPKILRLSELYNLLRGNELQQGRFKAVATRKTGGLTDEHRQISETMSQARARELAAKEQSQQTQLEIQKRLGKATADAQHLEERVQQIEKQRDSYHAAGLAQVLLEVEMLPALQDELASKKAQVQSITAQGSSIESRFAAMKQDVKDSIFERREKRRSEFQSRTRDVQTQLDQHAQESAKAVQRATAGHQAELSIEEASRIVLAEQNARAVASVELLDKQTYLPEIMDQLGVEQAALQTLYRGQKENSESLSAHEATQAKYQAEQFRLAQEESALNSQKEAITDDLASLNRKLNAADDTLLSFVRKRLPGWEADIAKVIAPELLMRDDLSPAEGVNDGSIYGLKLDLSRLQPVDAVDLTALESKIAALNLQLEELDTKAQALLRSSQTLQVLRKKHAEAKVALLAAQTKCDEDIAARTLRLESLQEEGDRKLAAARLIARAAAKEIADQLQAKDQAIKDIKSEHARHLIELNSISEQASHTLMAQRAEIEDALTETLKKLDDELAAELARIEADRLLALRDAGIDEKVVQRLENAVGTLARKVKDLTGQLTQVQEYKVWLADVLPQLPAREAAFSEAEQIRQRIEREISTWRELDQKRLNEYKANQNAYSVKLTAIEEQLSSLRSALIKIEAVDPVSTGLESIEKLCGADIEAEVGRLTRSAGQYKTEGLKLFREVEAPFNGPHRGTPEADVIQDIAVRSRNADATGERAWVFAAPDLQVYIDDGHDVQRNKLITRVRVLCNQVVESRKAIQSIHKAIQDVGRKATLKVAEVLNWFPEFTNFNLNVQSKIQEMTIWDDMSALSEQAARWMTMEAGTLPTDGLDHALRMMHRCMSDGWVSAKLEDCFTTSLTWSVNGMPRVARNSSELGDGLSTGQLKIVVGMIYLALFELIRRDASFDLLVPIDEALELEVNNAATLVNNFNSRNVKLLLGFPGGAPELMKHFSNLYALDRRKSGAVFLKEYRGSVVEGLAEMNEGLELDEGDAS